MIGANESEAKVKEEILALKYQIALYLAWSKSTNTIYAKEQYLKRHEQRIQELDKIKELYPEYFI